MTTVSAARNAEFCAGLGAEATYDYERIDGLSSGPRFDAIVDLHGTSAIERGDLRGVVEQTYPMEASSEAHRSIETGHSRGKRVVQVAGA